VTDELDVMRDARALLETVEDPVVRVRVAKWLVAVVSDRPSSHNGTNRGMSEKWRSLLTPFADVGKEFTSDDVFKSSKAFDYDVTRPQVRAQIAAMQKTGNMIKAENGYQLTEAGRSEVLGGL